MNSLILGMMAGAVGLTASAATAVKTPQTFCNPMSIPNMPVGIECWKYNDGDVVPKDKTPRWALGCWQAEKDGEKIAHQFRELADPEIHCWNGAWYLYPSCGLMWKSTDCGGTWENVKVWEHQKYYAPAAVRFRGKYYIAYSHGPMYVGDTPTGPWRELGSFDWQTFVSKDEPSVNSGDPALFADGDRLYVFLGCVAREDCLWGAELDPDNPLKALRPAQRVVTRDLKKHPWMRGPLEGAYMIKRGGTYYFMHAGSHATGAYATFVWKGPTPLGPFEPQANNPVFTTTEGCAYGGGHGGVFQDDSGDWWITYTIWPSGRKFHAFERFIGVDRLAFDEKGDVVSGGPTDEPQWLPSTGKTGPTGWKALKAKTSAPKTVDGKLRTYEAFSALPGTMTYEFEAEAELKAFRVIWCDLGLDVHRGIRPGPYQYRLDCRRNGIWQTWYDASSNDVDLTVDYREAAPVRADAVRITVLGGPKGMTPALTEFTVFGLR